MTALQPTSGALRSVRALAVTLTVVGLAAAGHLWAGGHVVRLGPALGGAALVFAAASVLARRRLRPVTMVALLGTGQLVLHVLFGLGGHHLSAAAQVTIPTTIGPAMIIGHVLATIATSVVLLRGEAALWLIGSVLDHVVIEPSVPVCPATAPVPGPRPARTRRPLPYDADRRGPPPS